MTKTATRRGAGLVLTAFAALMGSAAMAADLTVSVEVPRLNTASYHRPYVAIWVEKPGAAAKTVKKATP